MECAQTSFLSIVFQNRTTSVRPTLCIVFNAGFQREWAPQKAGMYRMEENKENRRGRKKSKTEGKKSVELEWKDHVPIEMVETAMYARYYKVNREEGCKTYMMVD